MPALVCIEHPGQIDLALKFTRMRGIVHPTVLALTPHVAYAIEKMGQPFVQLEDYHTEDDLHTLGIRQLDDLDILCEAIDRAVLENVPDFSKYNLRPGAIAWYELKILLNSAGVKALIFEQVLKKTGPGRVFFFDTAEESIPLNLRFLKESVWSRVIPVVCGGFGVACEAMGKLKGAPDVFCYKGVKGIRSLGLKGRVGFLIRRVLGDATFRSTRKLYQNLKRLPVRRTYRDLSIHSGREQPLLMTLSEGYSISDIIEKVVRREAFQIVYVNMENLWEMTWLYPSGFPERLKQPDFPAGLPAGVQNAWKQFQASDAFLRASKVGCVEIAEIVERRLAYFFTSVVPDILHTFLQARELLMRYRPAAVLAATMTYRPKAFFHAARWAGVPSVVYRHGSSGGYTLMETCGNFINYQNDLRWADYIFTNGEGDNTYYKKYYSGRWQTIAVGSAVLDRLRRPVPDSMRRALFRETGLNPERPVIFYCPTTIDGNVRAIPFRSRSPARAFDLERKIVKVFREFPEIQCVVKLPAPSPFWPMSPIVEVIRDEKVTNCVVLTGSFQALMPLADLFVTDYPSTTFLEMLTTDRPILVCGYLFPVPFERSRWHPSLLDMWRKRVVYSDDLHEFLEVLRRFLRERRFNPVVSDNEMLRLFGTHLDDGRSAERAVEELLKIAMTDSATTTGRPQGAHSRGA